MIVYEKKEKMEMKQKISDGIYLLLSKRQIWLFLYLDRTQKYWIVD